MARTKYIAKTNNIAKDGRYYYIGDTYAGVGDPGKHFTADKVERVEVPDSNSLADEQVKAMTKNQIISHIQTKFGIGLDKRKKHEELVVQAINIINDPFAEQQSAGAQAESLTDKATKDEGTGKIAELTPDALAEVTEDDLKARLGLKDPCPHDRDALINLAVEKDV